MINNTKLTHLYEKANSWTIFYKLILPSLLITLSLGIYVFLDQLLLVLLLPKNPNFSFNEVFKIDGLTDVENKIKEIISSNPDSLTFYDVSAIVKTANAIALPITATLEVVPYLIGVGAATYYAKNLASKNIVNLKKIFNSSIWFCIGLGAAINLIVGFIAFPVAFGLTGKPATLEQYQSIILNPQDRQIYVDYYNAYQSSAAEFAAEYLVGLSFSIIFSLMSYNISLILRCEAKNVITILVVVLTNVINLLLNFVFLSFTSFGMKGSSIATTIGFVLSCVILFTYLLIVKNKNTLHFVISDFNFKRNNFEIGYFWRILIISLSTFLYNLSYSIVFSIFTIFLTKTTEDLTPNLGAQYFQNLIGAVKPISALVFIGLGGIIDGSRSIATYCRSASNRKRFEQVIWLSLFISFIYSGLLYFIFAYALRYPLSILFSIEASQINNYNLMLIIVIAELPCSLIAVPNLIYFQATRKTIWANISSLLLLLSFIILIYPFEAWAYATGSENGVFNFVAFQPFNDLLGSILMFAIFLFFLYAVDKKRPKWFLKCEAKYSKRFFKLQEKTKLL